MEYLNDMYTSYPVEMFPQFLKFYNCLEFIPGKSGDDIEESSNSRLYWADWIDPEHSKSKIKMLYAEIFLKFKYDKYHMTTTLTSKQGGKLYLDLNINLNNYDLVDNCYDIESLYKINKAINIPELKQLLRIEFDKGVRYKDVDSLIDDRYNELYNRLLNEETLFNILKPYIEDIKNFELLFLRQSDFFTDNYNTLVDIHKTPLINQQSNQQRNE